MPIGGSLLGLCTSSCATAVDFPVTKPVFNELANPKIYESVGNRQGWSLPDIVDSEAKPAMLCRPWGLVRRAGLGEAHEGGIRDDSGFKTAGSEPQPDGADARRFGRDGPVSSAACGIGRGGRAEETHARGTSP
jgi:hypothetical protein